MKRTGVIWAFPRVKTVASSTLNSFRFVYVWDQCQEFVARFCPPYKSLKHTHEKNRYVTCTKILGVWFLTLISDNIRTKISNTCWDMAGVNLRLQNTNSTEMFDMFYCTRKVLQINRWENNTSCSKPLRVSGSVSARTRSIKENKSFGSHKCNTLLSDA